MKRRKTTGSVTVHRGTRLSHPKHLAARLRRVRCVLTDVDGVLTDGKLHVTSNGDEFKSFDFQDGHGIAMAKRAGLLIGFVSGRPSRATEKRAADLGVDIVVQQPTDKMALVETLLQAHGLDLADVCYIGDELVDVPVLKRVGLAVAVAQAVAEAKQVAHYVTRRPGGDGAVREVLELIMKTQGSWPRVAAKYLALLMAAVLTGTGIGMALADGPAPAASEPPGGGMIEKFEVPETDDHGNLKWKLCGDKARIRRDGLMDIFNMRAEFYSSNRVDLVFTTPMCVLDRARKQATTDAPIRIERANMVLTGTGGEWHGATSSFVVHSNVNVRILDRASMFVAEDNPDKKHHEEP